MESELKFSEYPDLYRPLILNSDLETITKLMDSDKNIENIVYELIEEIIDGRDYDLEIDNFIEYLREKKKSDVLIKIFEINNKWFTDSLGEYIPLWDYFEEFLELAPSNLDWSFLTTIINGNFYDDEDTFSDLLNFFIPTLMNYALKNNKQEIANIIIPYINSFYYEFVVNCNGEDNPVLTLLIIKLYEHYIG